MLNFSLYIFQKYFNQTLLNQTNKNFLFQNPFNCQTKSQNLRISVISDENLGTMFLLFLSTGTICE